MDQFPYPERPRSVSHVDEAENVLAEAAATTAPLAAESRLLTLERQTKRQMRNLWSETQVVPRDRKSVA